MQPKSDTFSDFSERTEKLADETGHQLRDLPKVIGFSDDMFFGYRTGRYPISAKAWRKLEAAERAAGLSPPTAQPLSAAAPGSVPGLIDQVRHTLTQLSETQSRLHELETDLTTLKSGLQSLLKKI